VELSTTSAGFVRRQILSARQSRQGSPQDRSPASCWALQPGTARKHGHDVLTVLRSLMTGNPGGQGPGIVV